MPSRMIRDGLLDSEAVLSLPVEARWLYVTILLSGDDVGLFEATPFRLARIADVRREHADRLLAMLVDADLVRLYEVAGKRYGFIPKFRQRLQIKRAKCPLPPLALLAGDEDALNKIKDLGSNPPLHSGDSRKITAAQPPEPEPEPEPEVEEEKKGKREEKTPRKRRAPAAPSAVSSANLVADGLSQELADGFLQHRKLLKAELTPTAWGLIKAQALQAGVTPATAAEEMIVRGWRGFKADWLRNMRPGAGAGRAQPAQNRFESINYREGINADGSF